MGLDDNPVFMGRGGEIDRHDRLADELVLKIATLTEDKGFGEWVFSHGKKMGGIVLFRYPARLRYTIANQTVEFVREHGLSLINNFTAIEPGRARIRKNTGHLDG